MGLLALLLSLVIDAFGAGTGNRGRAARDSRAGGQCDDDSGLIEAGRWRHHPLAPFARRLIAWVGRPAAGSASPNRPVLDRLGWLVVVGVPALIVFVVEWLASALFSPLVLVLHVGVLLLTVTLGPFYRRFSALRLLIGAGEVESADALIQRWESRSAGVAPRSADAPKPAAEAAATGATGATGEALEGYAGVAPRPTPIEPGSSEPVSSAPPEAAAMPGLERRAIAQSLLVSYRDVFAPLFWYLLLPGAVGAIIVHFARQAAIRSTGVSGAALAWIDWLPLRLIGLVFALVGKFEETLDALRTVSPIATRAAAGVDPYAHQRLLLLPVAGASLGLAIADAQTVATLRHAAPDIELAETEPEAGAMQPAAALLVRTTVVLLGLYVLILVLD